MTASIRDCAISRIRHKYAHTCFRTPLLVNDSPTNLKIGYHVFLIIHFRRITLCCRIRLLGSHKNHSIFATFAIYSYRSAIFQYRHTLYLWRIHLFHSIHADFLTVNKNQRLFIPSKPDITESYRNRILHRNRLTTLLSRNPVRHFTNDPFGFLVQRRLVRFKNLHIGYFSGFSDCETDRYHSTCFTFHRRACHSLFQILLQRFHAAGIFRHLFHRHKNSHFFFGGLRISSNAYSLRRNRLFRHTHAILQHLFLHNFHQIINFDCWNLFHFLRDFRTGKSSYGNSRQRKYIQILHPCPRTWFFF